MVGLLVYRYDVSLSQRKNKFNSCKDQALAKTEYKTMLSNLSINKQSLTRSSMLLKALETSLRKKDVLLSEAALNISNSSRILMMKVFFRQRKIAEYASNKKKKKNSLKIKRLRFLLQQTHQAGEAFTAYLIINLNKKIKFFIVREFLNGFKKFKQNLFPRRSDLFSDFLNTSCLLVLKKIKINTYIIILGQIFTLLLKKKHGSFFFF